MVRWILLLNTLWAVAQAQDQSTIRCGYPPIPPPNCYYVCQCENFPYGSCHFVLQCVNERDDDEEGE